MKHQSMKTLLGRTVLVAALLALVAGSASAATYNLSAGTTTVTYGTESVDVWGYALVSYDIGDGTQIVNGPITVPGPTIYVPAGQGLIINLVNNLDEATSIVVQGQKLKGTPQFSGGRVTAFTDEAAAGGSLGSPSPYDWSAAELKPGTFLYNSGSHPSKQVHMGLYGAVVVDAAPGTECAGSLAAYPGVCYDRDIVIIYSDVDPDLRNSAAPAQPLNFKPKYFLVNGDSSGNSILTGATAAALNSRVLLRFVNAGLKSYVPTLLGEDLEWVAEDGNTYPHVRRSYSAFLGAGKTMDAIWTPETFDRHALYDRQLYMSENGEAGGGLRAFLDSADTTLPTANAGPDQDQVAMFDGAGDPTVVQLDGSLSLPASVTYEWALIGYPAGSTATLLNATSVNPTFELDVPGTYTARLVVTTPAPESLSSTSDTVSVFTNLPPVAVATVAAAAEQDDVVVLDGQHSYDPDGDTITSWVWEVTDPDSLPVAGVPAGEFSEFTASKTGDYTVELTVSDDELEGSDTTVVTVSLQVDSPPIAGDDVFEVEWKTSNNVLYVLGNDVAVEPGAVIDPNSLTIVTNPMNGASADPVLDGSGNILYSPKNGFKGTDFFTYSVCDSLGSCSEAEVLVNVVK